VWVEKRWGKGQDGIEHSPPEGIKVREGVES